MDGEGNGTPKEQIVNKMEVEIDGKTLTLTAEDVVNLKKQQASATQKTQQVAEILDVANRQGLDPVTFAKNAEVAFGLLGAFRHRGYINDDGEIVEPQQPPKTPSNDDWDTRVQNLPYDRQVKKEDSNEVKALKTALAGLQGTVEDMRRDQAVIIRKGISDNVRKEYPNLDEEDISKILNISMKDRSKGIYDHAKELSESKSKFLSDLEMDVAKKYGIDIEAYNKKKSMGPDGGIGAVLGERKVSFNPKGPNEIHPDEALREWEKLQRQ